MKESFKQIKLEMVGTHFRILSSPDTWNLAALRRPPKPVTHTHIHTSSCNHFTHQFLLHSQPSCSHGDGGAGGRRGASTRGELWTPSHLHNTHTYILSPRKHDDMSEPLLFFTASPASVHFPSATPTKACPAHPREQSQGVAELHPPPVACP